MPVQRGVTCAVFIVGGRWNETCVISPQACLAQRERVGELRDGVRAVGGRAAPAGAAAAQRVDRRVAREERVLVLLGLGVRDARAQQQPRAVPGGREGKGERGGRGG